MKLADLLEGIEVVEVAADMNMEIGDISYDSRNAKPGDLFVAIAGFESDGHAYIGSAVQNGAVAIVCERVPEQEIPYVIVKNSRSALALTSSNYFGKPSEKMKIIGVTGTNGKTTSTMLIKHMIEMCEKSKVGLVGTNQNMIGYKVLPTERTTPESYDLQKLFKEMADKGCKYVVMEVSSHSLTLDRVGGINFEVGLFTNLTQDHLDFHDSMDDYARAKAVLFTRCNKGAVNIDDAYAAMVIEHATCPILTFAIEKDEAELVGKDIKLLPTAVKFCALSTNILERVALNIPGKFSVYNALGVIAVGIQLGYSMADCAAALKTATGVMGRVEVVPTDDDYTVLIDYAHTPDALENVLLSMKEVAEGRVVALFGCGGDRDKTKRPIMGKIAAKCADFVIVTSDNPRTEEPDAIIADIVVGLEGIKTPQRVISDRREAIAWAIDHHKPKDIIVLAGKGHETYQIIGKTKHHMDEREIVAEHLEKRKKRKP